MATLEIGVLDVWSKPFASQREEGVGGSLLVVQHCTGGIVYGESLSAFPPHFNGDIFSVTQCVTVT